MRTLWAGILESSKTNFCGVFPPPQAWMSDPLNPEEVLTRNHGWIERVAVSAARSHGLHDADAREFASWVTLKLIEDDYAVLRKFRGESNIRTYITTVVVRMSHAYSRERRGRWRPSRAAERLGPPASELETLVRRDGYSLEQAGEKLRTSGSTHLPDAELRQLLKQLPER
jgi:DNA-directed RNA polymerase specialized sigma24 family protein